MDLSRDEVLNILGRPRQAAQTQAVATQEDDPDEAARSLSLSRETGVPSGIINADPENFDRMYRGRLSSEIIGASPKLQQYINQDPLHAKISNDDWGKMLELGLALDDHDTVANRSWYRVLSAGIARSIREGGGTALQGAGYLTGLGELRNIGRRLQEASATEVPMLESEQSSTWGKIGSAMGGLVDLIPSAVVGGLPGAAIQMGLAGGAGQLQKAEAKGAPTATPFTAGFATGAAFGAVPLHLLLGLPSGLITKASVGTGGFSALGEAQEWVDKFISRTLYDPEAHYTPDVGRTVASAFVGGMIGGGAALFVRHGENPPPGVDPKVDRMHAEQAKEAADKFAAVRKALAATNTAQRSPEAMARYLEQYPATTWLSAEAMRKVYGDEAPEPGDGKLGDVPGVVEGYPSAVSSGADLPVDRAALLTKAKPELLDEIEDDIVHTFNGVSKNEAKEAPPAKLSELPPEAGPAETALDAVKRSAGLQPLGAAAAPRTTEGMVAEALTNRQLKLLDAVEAESKAEEAFLRKQNEAMVRRRQTKEWKDWADQIKPDVIDAVKQRADVTLTEFLEQGRVMGRKVDRAPRFNTDDLTEQQQRDLDGFHSKQGKYKVDDLARIFGYSDGQSMLNDLSGVMALRRQHGLGRDAWISEMVKAEVEARLERELGPLEGNILDEARQFVVSPTVMDRLWAEIENQFGGDLGSHDSFKAAVKAMFDEAPNEQHSIVGYLKAAGKYARQVESGLLDDKPAEALAAKMAQLRAIQMANLAVKVEQAQKQFGREMKLNADRTREGYPQEYMNFIHEIMEKAGQRVNRPPGEIQSEITKGDQTSLEDFVQHKIDNEKRSMPVAAFLFDAKPDELKNGADRMATEDFMALNDSIRTLLHNARAEGREIVQGQELERAAVLNEAVGAVERLPQVKVSYDVDTTGRTRRWFQGMHVGMITAGSLANRIHKGLGGVLSRIMGDFHDADYNKAAMEREFAKMIQDIDHGNLKKPLENGPIMGAGGKLPMPMTREKLIRVIINMGTKSSREAMIRGEAQNAGMDETNFATQLGAWINRVATPEDFKVAQAWVDMFEHFNTKYGEPMERRQSGIGVEKVSADSPFGNYKGGYAPLDYDSTRLKESQREKAPEQLPPRRAATPRGYTIKRTGYFAPVDLSLDSLRAGLSEMIHDAAYREVVAESGKLFYDNKFQNAMTNHMGVPYRDMLKDFIESKATPIGPDSRNGKFGVAVSNALRTNLVSSLIGFNPSTVMKHFSTAMTNSVFQVGPYNFARAVFSLTNPETAIANAKFVFESSKFMSARRQVWIDSVGGATDEALRGMSWNKLMAYIGTRPVAVSDLMSAVPTWLAAYEREANRLLASGETEVHDQSVRIADEQTRQAHGDPLDRPAFMRGRGIIQWFSSLYVFFNHIFQRHYELAWRSGDAARALWAGDLKGATQDIPKLTALFFSNVLMPALVEEMITPYTNKDKESWGHKAAHLLGSGLANAVPIVRDVVHGLMTGSDSFGLLGTEYENMTKAAKEVSAHGVSAKNAGRLIQDTSALIGALTGFPIQVGRSAKFLYNYEQGKEHPEGVIQFPWESRRHRSFLGGMWRGTAEYSKPRR
jgi:hypothetical protein